MFAETCVFSKQSVGPLHCGQPKLALLLPKLRSQFAEFLKNHSPERLRLLASPTCVSFSTDYPCDISRRAFLGSTTSSAYNAQGACDAPNRNDPSFKESDRMRQWAYIRLHRISSLRPPWARMDEGWNMNQLSIDYALQPRLRARLTLRGCTCRRKP